MTRYWNEKLTDEQVVKIRELYASGKYSMRILAKQFGVTKSCVSLLVRGKRRMKVGGPRVPTQNVFARIPQQ